MQHLQSLGGMHGDIKTTIVLVDKRGNSVFTDFDRCHPDGEPLVSKIGTPSWGPPEATHARGEYDEFEQDKLKKWLK
jgi:serine/threonine protein kinase